MEIKSIIIRLVADADGRAKIIKFFPHIFDGYVVTRQGEVLTQEQAKYLDTFNYYLDDLNFVTAKV